MRGDIATFLLCLCCTTICWTAGFTKPDEGINIFVQMAPWLGGGCWAGLTIHTSQQIWRGKRKRHIDWLTKKAAELVDTAHTYGKLGMVDEANAAAQEAMRLSGAALDLLGIKKEESCQEENPNGTSSSSDGT